MITEGDLLVFDLLGPMAHFRKFYTNSSSLTYSFPPRTVLTGIAAGILGYQRDSYYEKMSKQNCSIAVSIKTPLRKIMQTVNYIFAKSKTDLNGRKGHTQIPLEILMPQSDSSLCFRVYFTHKDEELLLNLKKRIKNNKYIYPPYLGITEFIASTRFVSYIKRDRIIAKSCNEPAKIHSVCPAGIIDDKGLKFSFEDRHKLQYIKEKAPVEFARGRKIKQNSDYIFEKHGLPVYAKVKSKVYEITYTFNGQQIHENIVFM